MDLLRLPALSGHPPATACIPLGLGEPFNNVALETSYILEECVVRLCIHKEHFILNLIARGSVQSIRKYVASR